MAARLAGPYVGTSAPFRLGRGRACAESRRSVRALVGTSRVSRQGWLAQYCRTTSDPAHCRRDAAAAPGALRRATLLIRQLEQPGNNGSSATALGTPVAPRAGSARPERSDPNRRDQLARPPERCRGDVTAAAAARLYRCWHARLDDATRPAAAIPAPRRRAACQARSPPKSP